MTGLELWQLRIKPTLYYLGFQHRHPTINALYSAVIIKSLCSVREILLVMHALCTSDSMIIDIYIISEFCIFAHDHL